jgi:mono/diheme cytochrome c family protein
MYMMECQGCHLADGGGGLNSVPTLRNSVAKFPVVPGGREYLARVPGVALSSLSDQDITAVLNWMLTKFGPVEWTRRYAPYTVEEVAVLRKHPLTEIGSQRAELILLIERLESIDTPG